MRTVSLNAQVISYELIRKPVKNINLRIKSDLSITVSANKNISYEKIDAFIVSKADLILKSLNKFKDITAKTPTKKMFVSGENFNILGKTAILKTIKSDKNQVYYDGVFLILETKNNEDSVKKEKQINKWYIEKAKQVFDEIARLVHKDFLKYKVEFPIIKVRKMKSRWGSCQPKKGIVTLNTKLFEAPRICTEYVIVHEFCHFLVPNHSKAFYTLLEVMMPDWKERKIILEKGNYII